MSDHPLIQKLFDVEDSSLPEALLRELVQHGPELRSRLLEIMRDEALIFEGSPGGGFAPGFALEVLVELRDEAAIEPALNLFFTLEPDDILWNQYITLLPSFGAPLVEPLLWRAERAYAMDDRGSIATMLAKCGVRDDAIFAHLEGVVRDSPVRAHAFIEYGDPKAIALLHEIFDTLEIDTGDTFMPNQDMIEVEAAIVGLGGQLSAQQTARVERAVAQRRAGSRAFRDSMLKEQPAVRYKPKRNGPCWCGSGKKYKKCHLQTDRDDI